jgi:CIC family chloride channel protein
VDWGLKFYVLLIYPLIGILLTVLYIKTSIRKHKFEHGLSQLMYSISKTGSKIPVHNTYSQIITSALTIGFGGSAGLEAPIAVTGAAIGSGTCNAFRLNYRDRTLLLACGTAAGFASVFNSPVAGMVLALELLLPQFSIPAFIPLLIASASATVVAQVISAEPLFVLVTENWKIAAIPYYILAGLLVGYFCNYFTKLNFWVSAPFKKLKNAFIKVWVGGLILGCLIAIMPALYGEGYVTIQELLNKNYRHMLESSFFQQYAHSDYWILGFALLTLFGKSLAALITVQAGGNGGSFGPSLVMGLLYSELLLKEALHIKEGTSDGASVIKDIMQPAIESALLTTPIYEIMQQMERANLRTIPIVNADNCFLGFITKNAIFNRYREELNNELEYF